MKKTLSILTIALSLLVWTFALANTIVIRRAHPAAGGGGGDVEFRSANSISTNGDPVPAPAGVAENDILVMGCANDDNAGSYTWPSGFNAVTGTPLTSSADALMMGVAIKIATASEPADYTVTHSTSNAICIIVAISGGNTSGVPHRSSVGSSSASNASPWSMTTASFSSNTTAKSAILLFASSDVTTNVDAVCTQPGGYTIPATHGDIREGSKNICFAYQDNVAAGATGALTMIGTAAGASSGFGVVAIALEVAP